MKAFAADVGVVLVDAVIVAGDGAGADIRLRADARVADIGEVVDLRPLLHVGVLDLDEVADMRALPDRAPGRSRANGPTIAPEAIRAPSIWLKARIVTLSATLTPGPKTTFGSIETSRPICVSCAKNTVSGAISVAPPSHRRARAAVLELAPRPRRAGRGR